MKEKIECKNWKLNVWVDEEKSTFGTIYHCPVYEYFNNFSFENYDLYKKSNCEKELKKLIPELNIYFYSHPIKQKFEFPLGHELYPSEIKFDETNINRLKNGFIPVIVTFYFNEEETVLQFKGEFGRDV